MKYTDVNGIEFTDEDIERWADETESPQGYTGKHVGPSRPGRPISVGIAARPYSIRLDQQRRTKLTEFARVRNVSPSQIIRELIDELPDTSSHLS